MRITREALDDIIAQAGESRPRECCGILMARPEDPATVIRALRARNEEGDRPESSYVLGHGEHIRAVELECAGVACIAGYYHSHPGGRAAPSRRDAEQAVEATTYLIVGFAGERPESAAWRREGDILVREVLEAIDTHEHTSADASLAIRRLSEAIR